VIIRAIEYQPFARPRWVVRGGSTLVDRPQLIEGTVELAYVTMRSGRIEVHDHWAVYAVAHLGAEYAATSRTCVPARIGAYFPRASVINDARGSSLRYLVA